MAGSEHAAVQRHTSVRDQRNDVRRAARGRRMGRRLHRCDRHRAGQHRGDHRDDHLPHRTRPGTVATTGPVGRYATSAGAADGTDRSEGRVRKPGHGLRPAQGPEPAGDAASPHHQPAGDAVRRGRRYRRQGHQQDHRGGRRSSSTARSNRSRVAPVCVSPRAPRSASRSTAALRLPDCREQGRAQRRSRPLPPSRRSTSRAPESRSSRTGSRLRRSTA